MVAAIGEQILAPTDVSLSNWTVRPAAAAGHAHRGSERGRLHSDPGGEPVTYNLRPGRELLFACRYRLGHGLQLRGGHVEADNVYDPLYGSFAGDEGAWSTAKMYSCTSGRTSRRRVCPTKRQERWTCTASRSWTQPWRPAGLGPAAEARVP